MDAVTYPHEKVAETLNTQFVPVRLKDSDNPDLAAKYLQTWTPTFLFLDAGGMSHYQQVGYLPPEDFLAALEMGRGWKAMHEHAYDEAGKCFSTVCTQYAKTIPAAEALYYQGVAAYKATHNTEPLKEALGKLTVEYPESEWARKVKAQMGS